MTADRPFDRALARYPALAVIGYVVVVAVLVAVAWSAVAGVVARRNAVHAASDMLARMNGRTHLYANVNAQEGQAPVGSPFLEGQTVTVAGAALLERVAGAVTKVGGNVLSSQVDLQGIQAKDGYVSLIASCEIEQAMLQQLLYDIEAGMPFLFVDQLVAQAPASPSEGGKMRVLLAVSGLWPGAK